MRATKVKTASRGFTLMEIMLVLVLLGSMATLVLKTLPSSSRELNQESDQLTVALQWAAQQAELDGKIYGLSLSPHQWQLMTLNSQPHKRGESYLWPNHYWHPVKVGKLQQQRPLPDNLTLTLALQDQPIPLNTMQDESLIDEPKIIFFPGGERSHFELTLSDLEGQTRTITEHGVQVESETSDALPPQHTASTGTPAA
ncbi:General secretion pathway protein H [Yersinia mollaretii ATCC 43969]|uniref:Type II secretion system protein H n=1 Tax=Yersinia mollaretii (strain ATCC 43969 / DSM 18520 / CIP 103324 / CNY 7263 / WAIP 204) TaxID=349967 RepID=A0ABP2EJ65_YERMW|nr:type II secretion system minor pseudopilin GspH [Yersinia mollaretii]EEQ11891.1 General secretion pathway protein H [Yersinia mollaretii ATCC 43969]QKJ02806.1 type II secretion system minor pseudopilin GspH [Yersinia mollaretii ATCC 43969]